MCVCAFVPQHKPPTAWAMGPAGMGGVVGSARSLEEPEVVTVARWDALCSSSPATLTPRHASPVAGRTCQKLTF